MYSQIKILLQLSVYFNAVHVYDSKIQLRVHKKYYDYHNERPPRISCTHGGIAEHDLSRVDFFKDGLHFLRYFAGNATKHVLVDLDAVLYNGAEHSTIDFPNRDRHVTGMYRCAVTYLDAYHHMVEEMSGDTELIVVVLPNDLPLLALDVRNGIGPSDTQIVEATCTTGVHSENAPMEIGWTMYSGSQRWPLDERAPAEKSTITVPDTLAGFAMEKAVERVEYKLANTLEPFNLTVECSTYFKYDERLAHFTVTETCLVGGGVGGNSGESASANVFAATIIGAIAFLLLTEHVQLSAGRGPLN